LEYVSRIDGLLESSLCREALADEDKYCRHCNNGSLATWRCCDCSLGIPLCRACIRLYHKVNPFHRIEKWNGQFFRSAALWEVGSCLPIEHHNRKLPCNSIKAQEQFLETREHRKDVAEQETLKQNAAKSFTSANMSSSSATMAYSASDSDNMTSAMDDIEMTNNDIAANNVSDEEFLRYLDELRAENDEESGSRNSTNNIDDVEDDMEEEELEEPIFNHYLPNDIEADSHSHSGSAQRILGSYVRVVHTNGIHHIAMITCECEGPGHLPNDLLAARFLPASFERIRTLFTAQLLDFFRLSNLELKSTAYHFYHLLQRLTNPMAPAKVSNLYREFRRMTRIWRWMKRLKWAGFGRETKTASEVAPGQLSVFCPACPQPGVNIPDNWKDDPARYDYFI
jgi:hypothetical protein